MTEDLCQKVRDNARNYWTERLDLRTKVFRWLEDHIMTCDPCALALEEEAEQWEQSWD